MRRCNEQTQTVINDGVRAKPYVLRVTGKAWRLSLMACLVLISTALAGYSLFEIFRPNRFTELEMIQLGLSMVLFLWLTMSFWTAVIGFLLKVFRIDPLSLKREITEGDSALPVRQRHAIVMPVYNEDTKHIMVGFEACVREVMKTDAAEHYDFYMLSDTQDEQKASAELRAWKRLQQRLGGTAPATFYRRREDNWGRKVGNITDFCERWGSQYESMLVLDADSVMSAERILDLTRRLEANTEAAMIQTIPMPVRQDTFFGRFVQFAAHLYSPMLATGLSFWQTDSANYWGHNAIIRVAPFMQHCGLPTLKGRAPFGGDVLSHDFVEAALLRRAGWECYLITDTDGSYEEVPGNLVDYAIRDRRWVQGNIQHLGLLNINGLKTTNRLHFLFGAFAYISSLLLFVMLMAGTADALVKALVDPVYFTSAHQLFPDWQIAKEGLMIATLWGTIALLFMPKLLGLILAMVQRRKDFGGFFRLLFGGVAELFMAILIAPVMMFYHSYFVLSVFIGHQVKWEAQTREGRMVPWRVAISKSMTMTVLALVWAGTTFYYTPSLFLWLLPVLTGMVCAAPIIRLSSSPDFGQLCRRAGIFVIQEELRESPVLVYVRKQMATFDMDELDDSTVDIPTLAEEVPQAMVVQDLKAPPLPKRPSTGDVIAAIEQQAKARHAA
ncbi:glucans biosynthesis glucosyltransferase MdoH [Aestuariibacter sp. A3R04]|uniref:glucans biosynthesis glucosyltransferase MdoH n=1 Tax=Aestuariibacter sp. A3R04 TaxID=2841571 RepID=UPI002090F804|nr:glucans biosynthesis glucosyltransferase MdoH [Aestuariibacter sp. A3R04]